jgi:ankyrin repeat protein
MKKPCSNIEQSPCTPRGRLSFLKEPALVSPLLKNVVRRLKSTRSSKKSVSCKLTLQQDVERFVRARGYSTIRSESLQSLHYSQATSYEKASFGICIHEILKSGDSESLRTLLSTGLSPNPYNATTGEYLAHMVCRRGQYNLLQTMIEFGGADILRAIDDFGRTLLHVVCSSNMPFSSNLRHIVTTLLQYDPQMIFMTDIRGLEPLSYVCKDHCEEWKQFLTASDDQIWPLHGNASSQEYSSHSNASYQSRTKLTDEIAEMLSSGRMELDEIYLLQYGHTISDGDETQRDIGAVVSKESNNNFQIGSWQESVDVGPEEDSENDSFDDCDSLDDYDFTMILNDLIQIQHLATK